MIIRPKLVPPLRSRERRINMEQTYKNMLNLLSLLLHISSLVFSLVCLHFH